MRNYANFIDAFIQYNESGECPYHILRWMAISAIGGALQRNVWFHMGKFRWFPNFYIVVVAPPGVVSKSTTADTAMEILRGVEGVRFGPSVVTWQALVTKFSKPTMETIVPRVDAEGKVVGGESISYSAYTIFSSEFGNLVAAGDRDMLDTLTNLWDCKSFSKETMKDGEVYITDPFLNIVACTTPAWISTNLNEYMIGSGLMSRCVMVYADEKRQFVSYPHLQDRAEEEAGMKELLIHDLKEISELRGGYELTAEAAEWGDAWYKFHWGKGAADERYLGYISRKQTHMHKLAMCLAAARGSMLRINRSDLVEAEKMLADLEKDMPMIFDFMGKDRMANQADRIVSFVTANPGTNIKSVYAHVHNYFPRQHDFEQVMSGLMKSGILANRPFGLRMGLVNPLTFTESPV